MITAAVYEALLAEGFRANVCKIVPSFSPADGTMQKTSVSADSNTQSFIAANLLQPEGCPQGNQNGRLSMNDETAGKRHARQRLDKQSLLKLFSETSIHHKSKEAPLPVERDTELEAPENMPGKECPPETE